MSTVYMCKGTSWYPADEININMHPELPPGNYIIQVDSLTEQLYLENVDGFELPARLYGDTTRHSNRILNTFKERSLSTGVLLSGEKGSGKTLLAKVIAAQAAVDGVPTIVVNQPFRGDKFNKLIQDINQPCIIFFDEFEKVYDSEDQEKLLTLLDGVFPSKKLFMLTCNDTYRIDRHMLNRPGRLFYALDFVGLTPEFVREYCEENLKNQTYIDQVGQVATLFDQFNFDMLKAMVEEMNRYDESPRDVLEMLNVKPRGDQDGSWSVALSVKGSLVKDDDLDSSTWNGNPLQTRGTVDIYYSIPATDDECAAGGRAEFKQTDLVRIEPGVGRMVFTNGLDETVTFTRQRNQMYDYRSALLA